ncbi:3'-5' exonuclease, partial [Candidatus Eisenbacteria bacterium]
ERFENVGELIEGARLFSSSFAGGLREYLDQVSLLSDLDNVKSNGDYVTLMTAHNAKGLEFPRVFVTGLEDGLFPHVSAFDDRAEMDEERRLFYVACTRAMDKLTLSACAVRRRVTAAAGGVSRFMGEVSTELYDESELRSSSWASPRVRTRTPSWGDHLRRVRAPDSDGGPRKRDVLEDVSVHAADSLENPLVGRRVFHATFGPGIVVAAEGTGNRARVSVRFHSGQVKKVLHGYLEWEP